MNNNRYTLAQAQSDIADLQVQTADNGAKLDAILTALQGRTVSAPTTPALPAPVVVGEVVKETKPKGGKAKAKGSKTKGKARKTEARKAPANGTIEGKRCLTKTNRHMFLADHEWAKAIPAGSLERSVQGLAYAVVVLGQPLTGNWAIGPQHTRIALEKAAEAGVKPAKAAKVKAPKATVVVVAEQPAKAPAKVFRRADGTVAPKGEYPMRAALEAQGLSRKDVDERVAQALAILA